MSDQILVVEDNDVSRKMMVEVLKSAGYSAVEASGGDEAISLIEQGVFSMALVDVYMPDKDGFELIEHLMVQGHQLPIVLITGDETSDLLMKATRLGVEQVLKKPVLPERLIHTVERALERKKLLESASSGESSAFSDDKDLILRSIEIAVGNAVSGNGRAFGAVVANKEGFIVGEGANRFSSRADPMGHAEVMAIRSAAIKLDRADLSDCTLYCSCEPTAIGKALINSVGIKKVFYSLSYDDIKEAGRADKELEHDMIVDPRVAPEYFQICNEEGRRVFSMDKPAKSSSDQVKF